MLNRFRSMNRFLPFPLDAGQASLLLRLPQEVPALLRQCPVVDVSCIFSPPPEPRQIYDPGRPVVFREFVEGVVRLASTIESQTPAAAPRRSWTPATTPMGESASGPANLPSMSPRSVSPQTNISQIALADSRALEARAGGMLPPRPDGRGGARDDRANVGAEVSMPSVSESFKRFVACNLADLSVRLASGSAGGGGGGADCDRERGKAARMRKGPPSSVVSGPTGDPKDMTASSSAWQELEGCREEVRGDSLDPVHRSQDCTAVRTD